MSPDPLHDPIFARALRRALGLPEDASNTATLAAAVEQAERLAAASERGAKEVLGTMGFGLQFNQALHYGLVDHADRDTLADLYALDDRAAVEVMFTQWKEAT